MNTATIQITEARADSLHSVVQRRAHDKSVRGNPVKAKLKLGQLTVENPLNGVMFGMPACAWPRDPAKQRAWVERLTPWWDMDAPDWTPTAHRLRESCVKAINKTFECGAAAPETADIPKGDASTSNGEGERAHRAALKSLNAEVSHGGDNER